MGDLTADVAMAKRGYGEMAITGTVAGPIFNILAGLGLSQAKSIFTNVKPGPRHLKINFGLWNKVKGGYVNDELCTIIKPCIVFDKESILPLFLLIG